jgi:hypothetical protein
MHHAEDHRSRVKNQIQHNVRKLLKEEGLSEIEKELSQLNSKYNSSRRSDKEAGPKEYSRLETFGHEV